ncbi:integrase [Hungatella hathewayi]|uniref:integrase n=1 Tax=Hungatella hathewayi TaxID=154046 RepID=UPI0035668124
MNKEQNIQYLPALIPKPIYEQYNFKVPNTTDIFDYSGYQVVRGEYFTQRNQPTICIRYEYFYVNTICLRQFPQINYIQILINPQDLKLVIRLCPEIRKDAFRWCSSGKRRIPSHISSSVFLGKLFDLLDWNPNYRYLCTGKSEKSSQEELFVFDLNTPKIYVKIANSDGKNSRTPIYPANWKDQFGVMEPVHKNSLQIERFNGYAILGIIDPITNANYTNNNSCMESEEKNDKE